MSKTVTLDELRTHKSKDSLYVLLHEKGVYFKTTILLYCLTPTTVYDVTKFIDEVRVQLCLIPKTSSEGIGMYSTQEETR
jgi:hypothetical protein